MGMKVKQGKRLFFFQDKFINFHINGEFSTRPLDGYGFLCFIFKDNQITLVPFRTLTGMGLPKTEIIFTVYLSLKNS